MGAARYRSNLIRERHLKLEFATLPYPQTPLKQLFGRSCSNIQLKYMFDSYNVFHQVNIQSVIRLM